jgi:hypothetical protein
MVWHVFPAERAEALLPPPCGVCPSEGIRAAGYSIGANLSRRWLAESSA